MSGSEKNGANVLRDGGWNSVCGLQHFPSLQSTRSTDMTCAILGIYERIHIKCCESSRTSGQTPAKGEMELAMDYFSILNHRLDRTHSLCVCVLVKKQPLATSKDLCLAFSF